MAETLRLDQSAHGRQIPLNPGDLLEVWLEENRTTGFRWNLEARGEPECSLQADFFQLASARVGSGGTHCWRFRAERPGSATIELHYRRSWESGAPARKFSLRINVAG
jgi:predicted secreted protein